MTDNTASADSGNSDMDAAMAPLVSMFQAQTQEWIKQGAFKTGVRKRRS